MKRIEFIAPVESMRGNLGEKQNLFYNPNNNRAYDSIMGEVNPALNYEPRLIASKGRRNYFSVKTKSSVHLTQKAKTAMSLLGGVGAIYAALVSDKTAAVYVDTYACYQDAVDGGYTGTLRKWLYGRINYALKNKLANIEITTRQHEAIIHNPWVKSGALNIHIDNSILVKFWEQFAINPVTFTVNGQKGIAHSNETFNDIVESNHNNLGLSIAIVDDAEMVKQGVMYVVYPNGSDKMQAYGFDDISITGDVLYLQDEPGQEGG